MFPAGDKEERRSPIGVGGRAKHRLDARASDGIMYVCSVASDGIICLLIVWYLMGLVGIYVYVVDCSPGGEGTHRKGRLSVAYTDA